MAFTLLQVDGALKSINSTGGLSSALTLPSGVQLATNRVPRFARFKEYVVVVNTPTRPISVSTSGIVRVLTPAAPTTAVTLAAGAAGGLTGSYLAVQTYRIIDSLGNVIAESATGPLMTTAVSVTAQKLTATFPLSSDTVSATQLYRTTAGPGSTYFPWTLVDGNVTTSVSLDTADAALGTVGLADLGSAPDLTLICEWGGRLWGVARDDVDDLRWTEAGTMYAWSPLNSLPIPHVGSSAAGITALIPRRAALGVARLDTFNQVTGTSRSNFAPTVVNGGEQLGVVSQESVVVFNDVAYFLWRDGVYQWDSTGIRSISNGKVRSWFTTDTYFNRSMFWRAFAQLDPATLKYRLFLASLGSAVLDRWVEYDILTGTWWGPHKTDAFTPTCAVLVQGTDQKPYFMIGSSAGYLSQAQEKRNDWQTTPVDFSAITKEHDMALPDYEKFFGELSVLSKPTDGTLTVTPTVGSMDADDSDSDDSDFVSDDTASDDAADDEGTDPFTYDMTAGRERLGRLGTGKQVTLQFDNANLDEDVVLYGYEVDPVNIIGRR